MTKLFHSISFTMICLLFAATVRGQGATDAEARLAELGIKLIQGNPPTANYLKAVQSGNYVYLSGHGPDKPEGGQVIGKLGADLTVEEGTAAARLVGISLLSSLKREIGDLNRVKRIVKVLGMVNATPDFERHSQVINGFSDLMVEVFGESGKHARSSVGLSSLPSGIPVEIEMIVELKD
ncbi:RidA family protein [Parapedobacter lycopersici]|uniref:RidA family protein n=1 Tax=Parapedobacter lycopersici TaxID=1864939 RepID=UPI00214D691E|nr:RidA family protein [Parapedobacter lycopersici]